MEITPFDRQVERLCAMVGIGKVTAQAIVAEIGVDMGRFPTAAHLASWAGMCPGNHESAGKRRTGKARKGNAALRSALIEAAWSASHSKDSYYLTNECDYADLGSDWFDRRTNGERHARRLADQIERLGYKVTVEAVAA